MITMKRRQKQKNEEGDPGQEEGEIHVVNDDHENDVVQDTQWPVDVYEQPENHADSPIILENHMQDPIKPTVNHNDDSESFSKPPADFGPIPFKFYNSWLLDSNLQEMVKDFLEHH
nr:RNA-directed DNA polymerase, eukaryota, reverse transcriptase zinc-binding domain protein [Tanacetum cinerariifolium]